MAALQGGLAATGVRWVDTPSTVERAELKLLQVQVATAIGAQVPDTLVTNDPVSGRAFLARHPAVAKAMSAGVGIAPFVETVSADDMDRLTAMPTMLQELIPASADLRVVVIGDRAWTRLRAWLRVSPDLFAVALGQPSRIVSIGLRWCRAAGPPGCRRPAVELRAR